MSCRGRARSSPPAQVREFAAQWLPTYMVPQAILILEKMPLTASGKINRKALPLPEDLPGTAPQSYVAPGTPTQQTIAEIWSELLKADKLGIHDDFFECGGHSLLATRLVSRIRRAFDVELPLRAVFEGPTIAAHERTCRYPWPREALWAGGCDRGPRRSLDIATLPERPGRLPLSYAQQRLWFLDKLEGSSAEYNMRKALRLKGELDCAALRARTQCADRAPRDLRTHFAEEDGEPSQVIEPAVQLPLVAEDLSALEPAERERRVELAMRAEADTPFDLGRGPLLRVRLLKLGEREHILLCTFHHIIFDGWSSAVFNRDLSALYEAFRRGEDNAALKPLPVQYADYALWQRERLEGEELERQLAYWKSQLADAPALALPTDLPRPLQPSFAGASALPAFGSGDCRSAQGAQPPGECHPFHDVIGSLSAAFVPLQRPGGHFGGHSGGQSQPSGVGGADRLLSGYPGLAHRFIGGSLLSGAFAPGAEGHLGGLRPCRCAL